MTVELSVVIPIHDEELILEPAIREFARGLDALDVAYEIWLAENGSSDATRSIARALAAEMECVHELSVSEPNYGRALAAAIAYARGAFVLCEEIDLCDVDFAFRALELLRSDTCDMVIGSKLMRGAHDDRPLFRHAASLVYSGMLRVALGFEGTDTHGLKAFRASVVSPIAARCVVDRDVFASELVIRAYREGVRVREIPVQLREKRPPSVRLLRRVPRVIGNLVRLTRAIGVR